MKDTRTTRILGVFFASFCGLWIVGVWVTTSLAVPTPRELANTQWRLTAIGNTKIPKEVHITLRFSGGRVGGGAGCNGYGGQYTSNKSKLTIRRVARTLLACRYLRFEDRYIRAFQKVNRYVITGKELLLYLNNQRLLRFLLFPPIPNAPLQGTPWRLRIWMKPSKIQDMDVAMTQYPTSPVDISFRKDGTFKGQLACLSIEGNYTSRPKHISVQSVKRTPIPCSNSSAKATSEELIRLLMRVGDYYINANDLCLSASAMESMCFVNKKPIARPTP